LCIIAKSSNLKHFDAPNDQNQQIFYIIGRIIFVISIP
jgi:hypothetical protein